MPTEAYFDWIERGRPWELARPIEQLERWAIDNGIPVLGTIANAAHLTAARPEDHTPFSATAWPVPLPGDIVTAIDLKDTRDLGALVLLDARAGLLPWLKYMNFDGGHYDSRDRDGDGITYEREHSSDDHVHLSIRSDWTFRSIPYWHPFRDRTAPVEDTVPNALIKHPGHPEWFALFMSGAVRHIGPAELKHWRDAGVSVITMPATSDGESEFARLKAYAAA